MLLFTDEKSEKILDFNLLLWLYFQVLALLLSAASAWRRQRHPLQCSRLENPMDRGAWWAAVHGVAKSWAWLSNFTFHFHALEKEMATHSSVLAWRIPGTEESGGLPSVGSHRVGHDWSDLAAAAAAASAGMAAYRFCINTAKAEDTSLLFHVCSPAQNSRRFYTDISRP